MKEKMILKRKLFLVFLVALSLMLTVGATTVNADLAVDFGASGLYNYDTSNAWTKLSTADAQWLGTYSGKLVADFGSYGLWQYDGAIWTKISTGNADNSGNTMIYYNSGIAVDFGTSGLWHYNGSWTRISNSNAEWMLIDDYSGVLYADFGSYGLWEYDSTWTKISTGNADNSGNTMTSFNYGIVVDFGASGLWYYSIWEADLWERISNANVEWLMSKNYASNLTADFGSYGLWVISGGLNWTKISSGNADNSGNTMVPFDGGTVVDFGASGLYYKKGDVWATFSSANVQWLFGDLQQQGGNVKLVADFGSYGLWEYNSTYWLWSKRSTANADNSGNTMMAW